MLRIFGLSLATTVAALVAAFLYGGTSALVLCLILGILEVSLSFDNAVVNAGILGKLNDFWQRIFLTLGVLIAAFGMRFALPMLVVWVTAGLNPVKALHLALHPPTDGSPTYEMLLRHAHPMIAAFSGMFLLMLFLNFFLEERETTWLSWIERPLAKAGRLDQLAVVLAIGTLLTVMTTVVPVGERLTVLIAGSIGIVSYILIQALGELFNTDEEEVATVKLAGRAALMTFLYLEVLDASMSFDGVMGAFAITSDPILIALGLGFIGAMFVRSLTVFLVKDGTLGEYVYLEHGAYWAIGALAVLLLIAIGLDISDLITGLVGVVIIALAFGTSVLHRRKTQHESLPAEVLAAA